MNDCLVCKIVSDSTAEVILEDTKHWRVALSPDQEYLGRVYVTLRQHKSSLSELSKDDWQELEQIVGQVEPAITKTFSPTHFNWSCLMNDAFKTSQSSHVHWHVHPRYNLPVKFAGREFIDARWPQTARTVNPHLVSVDTLRRIRKAINSNLQT